jgi:hypothetical protein
MSQLVSSKGKTMASRWACGLHVELDGRRAGGRKDEVKTGREAGTRDGNEGKECLPDGSMSHESIQVTQHSV